MITTRLMSVLVPFLRRHSKLMRLARWVQFRFWHLRIRLRTRGWSSDLDFNKTYWINPNKIEFALEFDRLGELDKYSDRGKIIGGNWDRKRVRIEEFGIGVHQGLEDRFLRAMRWEDTEFYKRIMDVISNGYALWECRNKSDLDERCRYLDSSFHDMKTNGYRTQQEIVREGGMPFLGEDEITIRIGHDGALLFEDGNHRLVIAKILDIDIVPVKITARHSDWWQFRKEVIEYSRTQKGRIYQPITHPDLFDIPSIYGDERFEMIKSHLPVHSGDLLDIGSHWGYFCHKFEEEGFNCFAVEMDSLNRYFLEKLKIAENRKFKIVYGSIFEYLEKNDFDVVLALNIFHHFLKTEETYYKLIELLRRLQMKVMFFQPPLPDSLQMQDVYRHLDCSEFADFILANSNLNEATYIGETADRRPIYRLQAI